MPTSRGSSLTKLFVALMALLLSTGGLSYALTATSSQDDAPTDDEVTLVGEETEEQESEELDLGDDGDDEGERPEKSPKATKARSTEGCPEGFDGNHGQFVSSSEDKQAAAHSECGKPVKPDNANRPEKTPKPEKTSKPVDAEKREKTSKPEKSPKPDKTPKADDSDDEGGDDQDV